MTEKLYRPNVGIMVINKNGKVLAAHRADTREKAWQMPQGGIDGNEEPLDAAKRELFEETGIKSVTLVAESKEWFFYDFPSDVKFISEKKKTFAGQKQKWFLFLFEGKESEIDLDRPHREFNDWRWEDAENMPKLIVEFKKVVYEKVVEEFLPFIDAYRS